MQEKKHFSAAIRAFIVQQFPAARKISIDDSVPLLSSGIVDSLGMLDLVGFLERSFAIQLADDELTPENFATIASLAAFVEQKKSEIGVGQR